MTYLVASLAPLCLFLAACGGAEPEEERSRQLLLVPEADATLYAEGPFSNGRGQYLFVGTNASGDPRRALLRFSLTDIPPGADLISARLVVFVSRSPAPGTSHPVTVHRVTDAWAEGVTDATGNEGGGTDALPGDVTWDAARHPATLWQTPGGDHAAQVRASWLLQDVPTPQVFEGPALLADVKDWLAGDANHGWILVTNEAVPRTAKRIDSRDHPDAARRPYLELVYTLR